MLRWISLPVPVVYALACVICHCQDLWLFMICGCRKFHDLHRQNLWVQSFCMICHCQDVWVQGKVHNLWVQRFHSAHDNLRRLEARQFAEAGG